MDTSKSEPAAQALPVRAGPPGDRPAAQPLIHGLLLLGVIGAALWLRTHDLAARPMHADEANQAVKLGRLLEEGRYVFDPRDHHGPTLYYFALIPAWFRGETTLAALTETTVRLTPALFGTAAILLLYRLARPLGSWPALGAAAFLALSPPAVYYSRYFIQETLLSAFTLGALVCGQRWWRSERRGWALATGAYVGLMQATKATAPVFAFAAVIALLIGARGLRPGAPARAGASSAISRFRLPFPTGFAGMAAAALLVAVLFYTSFLTHPGGLLDALATLAPSLDRAISGKSGHEKPWWYYGGLFVFRRSGGLVWDQSLFLGLATAGAVVAFRAPGGLARFIAIYSAALALVFSTAPYKTPWLVVNLVPGLAILAAAALAPLRPRAMLPLAAALLLLLAWQTRQAAFRRPADARNPLAYVHTAPDMLKVPALAAAAHAGPIKVISEEYWPLPWYLRARTEVGYWTAPPADCDGALVFASAGLSDAVRARLRGAYRESYLGLRPGFVLVVFTPISE